jgi:hypothetical protein
MLNVVLAALLGGLQLPVVDTIAVGHSALRGAALTPGTDTTEVYVSQGGTRRKVSTATQTVARIGGNYVVVFVGQSRGGMAIDSVFLSAATLAPVRHVEVMPDHRASFAFTDGHITGTSDSAGVTTPINLSVSANRFDFSVLQQVMDRLPFAPGYTAVMLSYDVATRQERAVKLTVTGHEPLTTDAGPVDAWKTVVDFGSHQVTRWIAAEGRRELRWEIARPGVTMEGVTKRG